MLGLPSAWGLSFAAPLGSGLMFRRQRLPPVAGAPCPDRLSPGPVSRTARLLAGSRGHGDSESCL